MERILVKRLESVVFLGFIFKFIIFSVVVNYCIYFIDWYENRLIDIFRFVFYVRMVG